MRYLALTCLVLAIIIGLGCPCHAILGLPTKAEVNAVKVSIADNATSLANVNAEVGRNMKSLADIKAEIGDIKAQLNLNANAIVGFKNQVSNLSSGRDTIQSQTNSDEVVKTMLNTYKYIIGLLIAQLVGLVIQMIVLVKYIASLFQLQIIEKDKMVERERMSRDDKDTKADIWMQKYIESVTGNKTNGLTQGQTVANEILVETLKDEANKI